MTNLTETSTSSAIISMVDWQKMNTIPSQYSIPLDEFTMVGLRNLVNAIFAKGEILSKATGGYFEANKALCDCLAETSTKEELVKQIQYAIEDKALIGINIANNAITFLGFSQENSEAIEVLLRYLVRYCNSKKRVSTKRVTTDNERFFFRNWLLQMGWMGKADSKLRCALYKPLTGNSAFRTETSHIKWKENRMREK